MNSSTLKVSFTNRRVGKPADRHPFLDDPKLANCLWRRAYLFRDLLAGVQSYARNFEIVAVTVAAPRKISNFFADGGSLPR